MKSSRRRTNGGEDSPASQSLALLTLRNLNAMTLAQKNGNDRVYTPYPLAYQIVDHFKPEGCLCDPCYGKMAFYSAMLRQASDYPSLRGFEIDDGLDFLAWEKDEHFDWIITNPPWSKLRAFLKKSMECSDNVVFLCLVNAFFMKARQQDMKDEGFGMKKILFVPTPPKPWPQAGFSLGAVHIQRGYSGPVTHSWL